MKFWLIIGIAGLATGVAAEAPLVSLRPVERSGVETVTPTEQVAPVVKEKRRWGLLRSLRPKPRSKDAVSKPVRLSRKEKRALAKGAVCGDMAIQGIEIGRVAAKLKGCGVDNAVKVREVSGVALSQQAVMDCTTARALKSWVDKGMKPAIKRRGGGVSSIRVVAHYACRTRNNQAGAKISEHGRGRAIDIAGFTLKDGRKISVLDGWGTARDGKALREMHKAACGPFGTVLGPNANRFHRDHFHFDTARYRSGSYCK